MIKIIEIFGLGNAIDSMDVCTDTNVNQKEHMLRLIGGSYNAYHKSIFEHMIVHYEIKASIKLVSQINRHKHIAISQQSTRYALRKMIAKGLQLYETGSIRADTAGAIAIKNISSYEHVANDDLSYCLTLGTITKARYTQTFHDFCMMIIRRSDKRAMKEAREFARECIEEIKKHDTVDWGDEQIYHPIFEKIRALYEKEII